MIDRIYSITDRLPDGMSKYVICGVGFVVAVGGSAVINVLTDSLPDPKSQQIEALKKEKQTYVFSGQGGQVSCDKSDDPITSEKTFVSKDIAASDMLRQALTIDIGKGTCRVQLKP